jgi:RimJ/RimL family protein N-acetyltransferase
VSVSLIALRPVEDADLDALFDQSRDWIDLAAWGGGVASRALGLLLELVSARPLHAQVASDNYASLRVLQKAGFKIIGTETSFAPARGCEIEETILRLE